MPKGSRFVPPGTKLPGRAGLCAALACLASAGAGPGAVPTRGEEPALPTTPAPVRELISARPFVLESAYRHDWRAERPLVRSGWLLVLRVDPDLVFPRNSAEPVLYVGSQTAERVNVGYPSGHVVALVPAALDEKHPDYLDLNRATIWFGTPELPEAVDARQVQRQRDLAARAGIAPLAREQVEGAMRAGGRELRLPDKQALLGEAATLVERYSPQERQLIEELRSVAQTARAGK